MKYLNDSNEFLIISSDDTDEDCFIRIVNVRERSDDYARILWLTDPERGGPATEAGFAPRKKRGRVTANANGEFVDKAGNRWKRARASAQHGGPHWDVTLPGGGHVNVMPPLGEGTRWHLRGKNPFDGLSADDADKARAIERKMERA